MWTLAFWKEALERAIKTAAQTLAALWVVGNVFNVLTVDWSQSLGIALGAMVLSFLTSLGSAGIGPAGSPSMVTPAALASPAPTGRSAWRDSAPPSGPGGVA